MTNPNDAVALVYLVHEGPDGPDSAVFAYFLHESFNGYHTCYERVGQHGTCAPEYAAECRVASPDEYSKLHGELTGIYEHEEPVLPLIALNAILPAEDIASRLENDDWPAIDELPQGPAANDESAVTPGQGA